MIDQKLLNKYNQPLPRYTSYPPATFFKDGFTASDYIKAVEESNEHQPKAISLYLHIPFCTQLCFYCGCTTLISRNNNLYEDYIDAIIKEIELIAGHIDNSRQVTQIHWGGGTPNALSADQIERIMNAIYRNYTMASNAEVAIECNPAYLTIEYIDRLLKMGFNRMSLGIQDFDKKILLASNREPSAMPVKDIVRILRNHGVSVNLDFIYGLPYQTPESFNESIKQAIDARPDRIVTFSYAHVPWVKSHQKTLEKNGIPGPDEKMQMFDNARETLLEAGYIAIGMDHYALPEDPLSIAIKSKTLHRNFQGYCTRDTTGQVYAFGMSAISQLHNAYVQNTKNVPAYIEAIKKGEAPVEKGYLMDDTDIAVREVINEIMCNNRLNWEEVSGRINKTAEELKTLTAFDAKKLEPLAEDGLLSFDDEEITVTPTGRFLIRNIAAIFDPKLNAGEKRFSKTI
ncbi:oxygen-independent coproporphyrinogen-3 oxidase [Marinilabilia salmonicolor]|jgi:oxygen-independent coproporphyrinogen-3 oxidase|uniref:oxygen-independent coproporphyrinogen III oxidase n=1 Tax=Marinilabilia salmonicolor TaxID=989 RepID=UPI000D0769AC|nr:oxygen-independent coproporphyrinogen III oxidase [Marinilabilia salmonicolor]PRZ00253.1 oxygen-independent coproporphyrinogen-3 oxidase [Marinilabilia salmonicolor]